MNNPFSALLNTNEDLNNDSVGTEVGSNPLMGQSLEQKIDTNLKLNERDVLTDQLLVAVFRFFVNPIYLKTNDKENTDSYVKIRCISLIDENECEKSQNLLSVHNVDQFLTERLMCPNINQKMTYIYVNKDVVNNQFPADVFEIRIFRYLFHCFHRIENIDSSFITTQQKILLRNTVINQLSLILCHPEINPNYDDIYSDSNQSDLIDLLEHFDDDIDCKSYLQSFFTRTADQIVKKFEANDDDIGLTKALKSSYDFLCKRLSRISLIDPNLSRSLKIVNYFVLNGNLSKSFIELNEAKKLNTFPAMNNEFQSTLIGLILSISCLPRPFNNKFEYFLNPSNYSQQEHNVTENNLGIQLNKLNRDVFNIIHQLLRHRESRKVTLNWIELCLYSFRDRAKMWTNEMLLLTGSAQNSSDGFMLNFSSVLLQLCKPFCIPPSNKLLKVDARYCRLKKFGNEKFIESISNEPFMTPSDTEQINDQNFELNFMTQCFFATHKALHLGFRVVHERFIKLVQDLNQIQHLYAEANASNPNSDAVQILQQRMDRNMTPFLSMKAMLCESEFIETVLHFHIATAVWLNNLAVNQNETEASKGFKAIKLPISKDVESKCLKSVPEFIIENISDFVIFIHHFSDKTFGLPQINLEPLMTMVIIFMGSPERLKNPHLRAKLAEMLGAFVPSMNSDTNRFLLSSNTDKLFTSHPFANELIPTVVHVFVSIEISEVTGENVAFEQKFGYRRPMYIVLKYLWNSEKHRNRMKELADYAEENMEAIDPPLFLRFINLLMNDAIFLLDEALSYMNQLREMQIQRDSGEWAKLAPDQRQQTEVNFHHTGRIAKFHNIMGRDTINTLSWLTDNIKTIFSNKTLVDRMAAMLNYFLLHLVGPEKRNFKVKDLSEYEFKPADIVHDICKIYLNLSSQENKRFKSFCLAIGRDERSYSPQLLPLASDVLIKTGSASLSQETIRVGHVIEEFRQNQKRREISIEEVPEEFQDPIMATLMNDPVILPNSGVKVDRSTIARHLLSDQTDPFTRSPLTMDMVIPDHELKAKIKAFVEEKLKAREKKS